MTWGGAWEVWRRSLGGSRLSPGCVGAEPGLRGGGVKVARGGAERSRGRPVCGGVEGRRRGQAAGHDRVVPVLPAAAGRAPLPLSHRYRPHVLMGGGWGRALWGSPGPGLERRASQPRSSAGGQV